jgi:hypothetical protein
MNLVDLIAIAKTYQALGSAVQEQLDGVMAGNGDACNLNALKMASNFLKKVERAANAQEWDEEARQDLIDDVTGLREEINSIVNRKAGSNDE